MERVNLDTKLLDQYYELLGLDGMQEMYQTFSDNIPGYTTLLVRLVAEQKESETRRQAHMLKGACRSVGLMQLAAVMEQIERLPWQWPEVNAWLDEWQQLLPTHQALLNDWLTRRRV